MTCAHPFRFTATMPAPTRPLGRVEGAAVPPRGPRPVVDRRGRPLHRWLHVRADGCAHRGGRRDDDPAVADRRARQRLPPSRPRPPHGLPARRGVGRPPRVGPGRRVDDHRLRGRGHPARPSRRAREPVRGGTHGGERTVRPGPVRLRRRALRGARPRWAAQTGAATAPAGVRGRRQPPGAATGRWRGRHRGRQRQPPRRRARQRRGARPVVRARGGEDHLGARRRGRSRARSRRARSSR